MAVCNDNTEQEQGRLFKCHKCTWIKIYTGFSCHQAILAVIAVYQYSGHWPDFFSTWQRLNLSPKELNQNGFEEKVLKVIRKYDIPPDRIEFEITERLVISNLENTIEKMLKMKQHVFRFSVDDFGTGYSSLAYLKELPINRLKIDRSFICDVTEDRNDATIVETIISMSHHLGLEVVAEGVETQEQHFFLSQHACDIFQGYYFSEALIASEITMFDLQHNKENLQ
ncbi:phytochrome-like protein cph2 [bacterium BMS3Bbin11]|nr:phytochrome-like protein cph2 [bacterium BMS3Abin11]GBE45556.1 phytochrome-like protein cph2 [bacterium BMS3Bbin11]